MKLKQAYIRSVINKRGLLQKDIADILEIPTSTLSVYLNNKMAPPWHFLMSLARTLQVPSETLVDYEDDKQQEESRKYLRSNKYPVATNIISASPNNIEKLILEPQYGFCNLAAPEDSGAFLLRVDDNRMAPVFYLGTNVMVDPSLKFCSGLPHLVTWQTKNGTRSIVRLVSKYKINGEAFYNCTPYLPDLRNQAVIVKASDIVNLYRITWHSLEGE